MRGSSFEAECIVDQTDDDIVYSTGGSRVTIPQISAMKMSSNPTVITQTPTLVSMNEYSNYYTN